VVSSNPEVILSTRFGGQPSALVFQAEVGVVSVKEGQVVLGHEKRQDNHKKIIPHQAHVRVCRTKRRVIKCMFFREIAWPA